MLHALLQYAHNHGLAVEPGFKSKRVRWLLVFQPDGNFLNVLPLKGDDDDGQLIEGVPDLSQPELKGGGAGCRHFLVDNLEVVALWTKGEADDKLAAKHAYFVDLLEQAAVDEPRLGPIAASLKSESVLARIHKELTSSGPPKPKPTDNATVAILDADMTLHRIVDLDSWRPWWRGFRASLGEKRNDKRPSKRKPAPGVSDEPTTSLMRCLLSGAVVEPASTHGTIQGLADVGGQSSGDRLASFKQGSFTSYGLQQAANAAMSEDMAATYTAALNDLLLNHAERLAGAKVAYWYTGQVPPELDPVHSVKEPTFRFEDKEEDDEDLEETPQAEAEANTASESDRPQIEARAGSLLRAIQDADRKDLLNYRYQALTLSANSGRIVVRDWMEGQFEQLAEAVDEWFDDLTIQSISGRRLLRSFKFESVATCMLAGRKHDQKYEDWIKPIGSMREALWRCALGGRSVAIPPHVVLRVLGRQQQAMRSGELETALSLRFPSAQNSESGEGRQSQDNARRLGSWYARCAILKAFLIRNRTNEGGSDVAAYLNKEHSSPAYHSGRLLAVLQHVQSLSIGDPKASVIDRFYSSCSVNPALIIPRIWTVARHHLRQVARNNSELAELLWDLLREIHSRLSDSFPTALTLEEQSLFQLGFFQQQQFLPVSTQVRKRFQTRSGEWVRSKSEKILADKLNELNISYIYEQPLVIEGEDSFLLPDFTIERGENKVPIYVEHLGLLGKAAYEKRWKEKLEAYNRWSILPAEVEGGTRGILLTTNEADISNLDSFISRLEKSLQL